MELSDKEINVLLGVLAYIDISAADFNTSPLDDEEKAIQARLREEKERRKGNEV